MNFDHSHCSFAHNYSLARKRRDGLEIGIVYYKDRGFGMKDTLGIHDCHYSSCSEDDIQVCFQEYTFGCT